MNVRVGDVFYHYGNGYQVIFENGNYDGFSLESTVPIPTKGRQPTEDEYFIQAIGHTAVLAKYKFSNVIQLSRDYDKGIFDVVFKPQEAK
jgi:hypothetical protein